LLHSHTDAGGLRLQAMPSLLQLGEVAASYSFATYVDFRLSPLFQLVFAVLATFTF